MDLHQWRYFSQHTVFTPDEYNLTWVNAIKRNHIEWHFFIFLFFVKGDVKMASYSHTWIWPRHSHVGFDVASCLLNLSVCTPYLFPIWCFFSTIFIQYDKLSSSKDNRYMLSSFLVFFELILRKRAKLCNQACVRTSDVERRLINTEFT